MFSYNIPEMRALFCDMGRRGKPLVISVTGAGGKTSTLFWLARCFRHAGRRVMITTTTHMYLPAQQCPVVICRQPDLLPDAVMRQPLFACYGAWHGSTGKCRGFLPREIDRLARHRCSDVVLIEADGARNLPLKAPDEHEPCIPASSHCVIAVTGGQMYGRRVMPEQVHRWQRFAAITGLKAGDRLNAPALARLVRHPRGMFKGTPSGCRRIWLINRLSHYEKALATVFTSLLANHDVDAVWLGAVGETPAIRCRLAR